ncbi:hypothetical protein BU24DRAFT_269504 [Aaosphaeria arxii CBS 175.79]|uniref:Uncharacterized protein n=1 Tax=Aaosphaeria arxii CBS 175.79 TaxID=1450172 RepID=A0A6A5XGM4_9PLEO|nr:uncharacterized protein BU24DRAFT_269504 [Aaosphaeria arxii CBS 175.79]KAF2012083.1 hypothetical protein BU24DRAFT_269504 [Aaosphaeria arxii CBS 175.79]
MVTSAEISSSVGPSEPPTPVLLPLLANKRRNHGANYPINSSLHRDIPPSSRRLASSPHPQLLIKNASSSLSPIQNSRSLAFPGRLNLLGPTVSWTQAARSTREPRNRPSSTSDRTAPRTPVAILYSLSIHIHQKTQIHTHWCTNLISLQLLINHRLFEEYCSRGFLRDE